ncbi:hypothetical protein HELRODRAFT_77440 [Helobdella robusta]|uniref:Protein root UVB sensitive/RUS domain-containing protein n=1 Tax=Helobdella robusta TaxID=6412 RepID=T1G2X7_HELRO|nr:hypothetical protein HELRODRAFT_77440 [Helobdella robusta]ESO05798.1 hypothetical protein HELRODRAFT_77440 [Helobdella robusta]
MIFDIIASLLDTTLIFIITLQSIFMPQGYPESVSGDYLEYQIWDTIQAFCSSITATLATQSILKGVGVGDSSATIAAATLTWLLKDGTSMVGRIMFAWFRGSVLDCDCKRWRFFADILNDVAIFLDIIAQHFVHIFTLIVCISGILKSVVGVAGGSTRSAIMEHQARRNNMADLSAKDGSQETLVNLAGLMFSILIIPSVSQNTNIVWLLFLLLTGMHLYANYRAVRCIVMETLNQTRLRYIVFIYLQENRIASLFEANRAEPILTGTELSYF